MLIKQKRPAMTEYKEKASNNYLRDDSLVALKMSTPLLDLSH